MSVTPQRAGLRERKNKRTQDAIIRAAAELTLDGGWASATIPRIAERADVAPRTVSGWFPVKEDLLFGLHHEAVERGLHVLRDGDGDGDVLERFDAWLAEGEGRVDDDPELTELRFRAILSDPMLRGREAQVLEPIRTAVAEGVAEHVGAPVESIGVQVLATATMSYAIAIRARELAGGATSAEREAGRALLRAGLEALERR
jgi:AcrR family transcriptional regulator